TAGAATHGLDDLCERPLHVDRLAHLVLRPPPVKAQDRDAPLVLHARVDLTVGVLVRNHLPAAVEIDERAIVSSRVLLELRSIAATGQPFETGHRPIARHSPAAVVLDMIAAREAKLAAKLVSVEPPGHVHLMPIRGVLIEG